MVLTLQLMKYHTIQTEETEEFRNYVVWNIYILKIKEEVFR